MSQQSQLRSTKVALRKVLLDARRGLCREVAAKQREEGRRSWTRGRFSKLQSAG